MGEKTGIDMQNVHNVSEKRANHREKYVIKVILSAAALWIAVILH